MAFDWKNPGTSSKWPKVVLLWGDDHGAIAKSVEQIRHAVLLGPEATPGMDSFNHERFEGPYLSSMVPVLKACTQVPMLAPRRLVECSDPDQCGKQVRGEAEGSAKSSSDEVIGDLIAYFEQPVESAVLVLTSGGINGTSRLVKAAKAHAGVDECRLSSAADVDAPAQILASARELGFVVTHDAARRLVELVGPATHAWLPALERARSYAGEGTVDVRDVEAVVNLTRDVDVFALTDAIGRRSAEEALAYLGQIFAHNEKDTGAAMRLLGLLIWHFRRLFVARVAKDPAGALNQKPFLVGKLVRQAQAFKVAELEMIYTALMELDASFKGGSAAAQASPLLAIQRWVLLACGELADVEPAGEWLLARR
jgi:DNA polymerase-3 subunit delta